MRGLLLLFISIVAITLSASAQNDTDGTDSLSQSNAILTLPTFDADDELILNELRNIPTMTVGKGITFSPNTDIFSLTLRFRMQNRVSMLFDSNLSLMETDAQVRRLRLRFDGYVYSPKLVYSIQLGFASSDTEPTSNGNTNIVMDGVMYYVPNNAWSIGFGQTKIKANRSYINSSSALQFVDRSIVNSQFNLGRDFGFFGQYDLNREYNRAFTLSAKSSITLGQGQNWLSSEKRGYAYMGRLELYPFGRFAAKGDILEGDFVRENKPKVVFGAAYSLNDNATRLQGTRGNEMPPDASRDIESYFADFVLKYRGFALYGDLMGRKCDEPLFEGDLRNFVYTGWGMNFQASYLFKNSWEIALRNSTLLPDEIIQQFTAYKRFNQTTLGVTRYIIGHTLKAQADISYNSYTDPGILTNFGRWEFRFQLELGL